MIAMPRVGSGGRATAVVKSHYPKSLIFISRQDCVAGAHTCLPRMAIKRRQRSGACRLSSRVSNLAADFKDAGGGRWRETVASLQHIAADLVNPAEYETERERD